MSENNGKKVVRAVHVNVVLTLKTVLNVRTNLFIQILSILIGHVLNGTLKAVNLII